MALALEVLEGLALAAYEHDEPHSVSAGEVYSVAHAGLGRCANSHADWLADTKRIKSDLRKAGIL